jgi:diaminopropionate ammonia-lyase
MRALVNPHVRPGAVPAPSTEARAFHAALPGYAPTPVHDVSALAPGTGDVRLKDESNRLGLPAFKVLGASWAIERALRERPDVHTLVAASAGNHGRAVAHVAAARGLRARVFLPARSVAARREAIAGEGADVVVIDGTYEDAVAEAARESTLDGRLEVSDVGSSRPAAWVIDGYATLFAEAAEQADPEVLLVPVGVGSLAAAAARYGANAGVKVIGVEPVAAACLTASLTVGEPVRIDTPGTAMAGLDCAEVSAAAWPSLRDGIHGTVTVDDGESRAAMRALATAGLAIGDSGAAALAALVAMRSDRECAALGDAVGLGPGSRVLLLATEGPTDPEGYAAAVG